MGVKYTNKDWAAVALTLLAWILMLPDSVLLLFSVRSFINGNGLITSFSSFAVFTSVIVFLILVGKMLINSSEHLTEPLPSSWAFFMILTMVIVFAIAYNTADFFVERFGFAVGAILWIISFIILFFLCMMGLFILMVVIGTKEEREKRRMDRYYRKFLNKAAPLMEQEFYERWKERFSDVKTKKEIWEVIKGEDEYCPSLNSFYRQHRRKTPVQVVEDCFIPENIERIAGILGESVPWKRWGFEEEATQLKEKGYRFDNCQSR